LEKKVASKASFLAGQLLVKHPNMKKIVVQEVERLIKRPNITDRARYYAITFLNQIVLTMQNQELANHLISLYFSLFEILVHSIKKEPNYEPKKKNRHRDKGKKPELILDSVNSKLMAQLLLGVNRSFPFSNLDEKVFNSHLDTLFLITHISNFNTSIQALSLIFHVQSSKNQLTDRFYKALYDSLFDPRLIDQAKQSIYLNLLYRALKRDNKVDRVMAFVKRIIQMGTMANVPLVCASLFLIGELFEVFPALKDYLEAVKSDCSDTIKQLDNEIQDDDNMVDANKSKNTYDAKARDPLYAHAEKSKLWDLVIFQNHFHPTVALYSKTILQGKKIELPLNSTNYDPLHNHTLQRFLDRIIQKAPKKVKTATKGESIMQPKLHHDSNIFTSKKRANFEFTDYDGNVFTSSHNAVDQEYLKNFIMKNDSKDKELDEDEIWEAMVTSKGFDKRGLDEDVDPEFDDLEFDYDSEDDDMQKWADEDNQCDVSGNDDVEQLSNGDEEIEWLDEEFKGIEKDYSDKYEDDGDEIDKAGSESDDEFENIENGELNDLNDSDLEEHMSKQLLCEEEEFDDKLNEESSDKSSKKSKRLKKDRMAKLASKLGYTGDFFMTKGSDFASAEDFELLQNMNSEEDETNITKRKSNTKFKKSKKQKK
jgi:ribosome biogenesis protein MAK21